MSHGSGLVGDGAVPQPTGFGVSASPMEYSTDDSQQFELTVSPCGGWRRVCKVGPGEAPQDYEVTVISPPPMLPSLPSSRPSLADTGEEVNVAPSVSSDVSETATADVATSEQPQQSKTEFIVYPWMKQSYTGRGSDGKQTRISFSDFQRSELENEFNASFYVHRFKRACLLYTSDAADE